MVKTLAEIVAEAQGSRTDEAIVAASRSNGRRGFTRQTLAAVKQGRPVRPDTFESLMRALDLDANEVRGQLGWAPREVAEPFIHGVPSLDQLNAHYRRELIHIGYEFRKAQRWSESQRNDVDQETESGR